VIQWNIIRAAGMKMQFDEDLEEVQLFGPPPKQPNETEH